MSGQAPEPVVAASLGTLYRDLPRSIHDELSRDPDFMAAVGMVNEIRMQIGTFQFRSQEFWRAATEAVNGRPASVATVGDEPVTVVLHATEEPVTLTLIDPATGNEPTVTLSVPSPPLRVCRGQRGGLARQSVLVRLLGR